MTNFLLRAKNRLQNHFVDIDLSNKSTIFIAGMGRSGTTWLSEIINYKNDYRDIFEPFIPYKVNESSVFKYLQYLHPNNNDEQFVLVAKKILAGNFKSDWTDVNHNRLISHKRIIKEIRANLMLKWLINIRPNMPLILLIRNPLAVIDSYISLGWGTEAGGETSNFNRILLQKDLLNDFPIIKDNLQYIDQEDYLSQLIFVWCILYYVPLNQLNSKDYLLVHYENLIVNPGETLKNIFKYLDQSFNFEELKHLIKTPSGTNYRKTDFNAGNDEIIQRWKKSFSDNELIKVIDIIYRFELSYLYNKDGYPK